MVKERNDLLTLNLTLQVSLLQSYLIISFPFGKLFFKNKLHVAGSVLVIRKYIIRLATLFLNDLKIFSNKKDS